VVIFNTVMNTLLDTLLTRADLGYSIDGAQHRVNLLQYADDACLLANSPSSCQHLLGMVEKWLQWSGMKAKVQKCSSLAFQGSSGKLIDPKFWIAGQQIPFAQQPVKFLGMRLEVPHNSAQSKAILTSKLQDMLQKIDK